MNTETLRLLVAKGLSAEDILEIAEVLDKPKPRSANAERQARYRRRRNGGDAQEQVAETVTDNVTRNADSNVTPSLSPSSFPQTPNQHPHTHPDNKPAREGRGKTSKSAPPAKPETVKDQTWADFLALRKSKHAPLTETALAGIVREAGKAGWTLEDALAKVVTRGWQSFEARFVENDGKPPGRPGETANFLDHYLSKQAAASR